ncbi:type IV pilus assembly protein PilO [Marinospirillum celere]|uniref:Type IV pilus assembly protein PilO n=1 Tax=Marinospirillum celere TaxID=1122252 RepID=A0A1I1IPR7_9GAMM|nr:type 4a pilus biogenesis protein PilO [Marinospirillum celere]SFC37692.1 type IV pilus assembly protein PilO [Marinospirillum celere]
MKRIHLPTQDFKHWLVGQWRAIKRLEKDDLDLQRAGQWPYLIKGCALLCLLIGVIFVSNWLLLATVREDLQSYQNEQQQLFERYQTRAFQAANLTAYQQQMRVMEATFADLLSKLPIEREIPRLIEDIQDQADRQRLEVQALNLRSEQNRDFYTELPFEIRVRGDFHRLASFMAGISSLDRIITLHDFTMTPEKRGQPTQVNLLLQARTYRYDESIQPPSSRRQGR